MHQSRALDTLIRLLLTPAEQRLLDKQRSQTYINLDEELNEAKSTGKESEAEGRFFKRLSKGVEQDAWSEDSMDFEERDEISNCEVGLTREEPLLRAPKISVDRSNIS